MRIYSINVRWDSKVEKVTISRRLDHRFDSHPGYVLYNIFPLPCLKVALLCGCRILIWKRFYYFKNPGVLTILKAWALSNVGPSLQSRVAKATSWSLPQMRVTNVDGISYKMCGIYSYICAGTDQAAGKMGQYGLEQVRHIPTPTCSEAGRQERSLLYVHRSTYLQWSDQYLSENKVNQMLLYAGKMIPDFFL